MGVQGLWELLAPVGRRVSVDTLAGKRLAIDASIWMVQFMKAMRDDKGEMLRNAHLIGFFRRICKLLYLRTKPIFVFDGGTPTLKRRTVIARRRQRENAQAKIRKTAEKLLLNQLKGMRLKELAKNLENQRRRQKIDAKGKNLLSDEPIQTDEGTTNQSGDSELNSSETKHHETLSASSFVQEDGPSVQEHKSGDDEGLLLMKDAKGKGVLLNDDQEFGIMRNDGNMGNMVEPKHVQEQLDEMLAASIAAEEGGNITDNPSTSGAALLNAEEEEEDEDEQMLVPEMHGNVDPAVLASLPPSMQLELLVKMRERLMAENRQKYQKVKKAPEKFSELQVQAYLKTVAFRREIDEVQKSASGRGVGGVQTSRIASEANREFIFSSSFSGDKQLLKPARVGENGDNEQNSASKHPIASTFKSAAPVSETDSATNLGQDDDIEIYKDERGRLRIRNRHMGIHMTRDIQRNLSLMKEKERRSPSKIGNLELITSNVLDSFHVSSERNRFLEPQSDKSDSLNLSNPNEQFISNEGTSFEISFDDDGEAKNFDEDADIFTQLAAGVPLPFPAGNEKTENQSASCGSDSDWENLPVEESNFLHSHANSEKKPSPHEDCISDESEIEWEEAPGVRNRDSSDHKAGKMTLKSHLEEEASLREAIRRSLRDIEEKESMSPERRKLGDFVSGKLKENAGDWTIENPTKTGEIVSEVIEMYRMSNAGNLKPNGSSVDGEPGFVMDCNLGDESRSMEVLSASNKFSHLNQPKRIVTEKGNSNMSKLKEESAAFTEAGGLLLSEESLYVPYNDSELTSASEKLTCDVSYYEHEACHELPEGCTIGTEVDSANQSVGSIKRNLAKLSIASANETYKPKLAKSQKEMPEKLSCDVENEQITTSEIREGKDLKEGILEKSVYDVGKEQMIIVEGSQEKDSNRVDPMVNIIGHEENGNWQLEYTDADLEKELQKVDLEYLDLGDEQRRLERNAESVSSEMFAECQELLQIFGLPYIIAPMEAEAQCAHMELSDLVDGVVTDDSDVFLFGATSVYKNIFDDRKYVETYFTKDIEKELGLNREKLIRMALLLGSDYTEGISGIGIVNAIEVVAAFPEEDGLQKFQEWVESPDPSILGKTNGKVGSSAKKRGTTVADEDQPSSEDIEQTKKIFMDKHRNVSKNWHIPPTFPNEAVILAYTNPQVDKSTEPLSWGKPDLLVLRKLCWEKFGWNSQKTDDLLLPVLKEYDKRETQLRLEAFYTFNEKFAKIRSKRIKKALKRTAGSQSSELIIDTSKEEKTGGKQRIDKPLGSEDKSERDFEKARDSGRQKVLKKKMPVQRSSRGSSPVDLTASEAKALFSAGDSQPLGRSGGKKRGRSQKFQIEAELKHRNSDLSETSSDEYRNRTELYSTALEQPQKLRRSKRARNPVNYQLGDSEVGTTAEGLGIKECTGKKSEGSDILGAGEGLEDASFSADGSEKEKAADLLQMVAPTEDYLQNGGGFCTDDTEIGEPSLLNQVDPQQVNKPLEDYLVTGGGFYADESQNVAGSSNYIGFLSEAEDEVVQSNANSILKKEHEGQEMQQNVDVSDSKPIVSSPLESNVTSSGGRGLRAMPSLKRKRRNC